MPRKFRNITNTLILAAENNGVPYEGNGTILDLMENGLILKVFCYLSNQDVFWHLGFTCRHMFDLACSYVNVIEFPWIPLRQENQEAMKIYEGYILQITEEAFVMETIKNIAVCQQKDKEEVIKIFEEISQYESKTIVFYQEDLYKMPWFGRNFIFLTTKCLYVERLQILDNLGDEILKHVLVDGVKYISALDITGCKINDNGLKKITDPLSQGGPLDGRKELHSFKMSCNTITNKGIKVLAINCLDLKELYLTNCTALTSDGLKDIAENCTDLQTLHLSYAKRFKDEDVQIIAQQFDSIHRVLYKKRLEHLGFSMCRNISDEGIISIGYHLKNLLSIDLCGAWELSDQGISCLVESCQQLRSIDVSGCWELTDKSLKAIADNCLRLETLNLGGCGCVSDSGIALIAVGCKHVKQLGLSACIGITDNGFQVITDNCYNLLSLDLSGSHNLSDDCAKYVVDHSDSMKLLDVRRCEKLSDECVSELRENKHGLTVLFKRALVNEEVIVSKNVKTKPRSKHKFAQKMQAFRRK